MKPLEKNMIGRAFSAELNNSDLPVLANKELKKTDFQMSV
jgi:hypothetical protein